MATWSQLRAAVAARHRLVRDERDWFGVRVGDVPLAVRSGDDVLGACAICIARVCHGEGLDVRAALAENVEATLGFLALQAEGFVLRHAQPLVQLTPAALIVTVEALAARASRLRRLVRHRPVPEDLFHHLAG